ncbi:MAG TPA: hypothetical protein VLX92_08015 [Kofleriaceae bacterium]|nr:hypothetical protein [Kofleriaceae bacterium]
MIDDLPDRYHAYLERFAREIGEVAVGSFAKFRGKLIKKLSFEEFTPAFIEYTEIAERYAEGLANGDTINDVVLKVLRDQAAKLVLEPPD